MREIKETASVGDRQRGTEFHDAGFTPRRKDETARDFLWRSLNEHRETHVQWRDYYERTGDEYETAYQGRAIERYDEILIALAEITTRTVKPPRNPSSKLYMDMNGIKP